MACATRAGAGDENWDARFNLPPDQGVNGTVNAIAVSGNNVYVGGYFTKAGTVNATNIARWDGSSWAALGDGVNDEVYAIAVYGTNVYVGGDFSQAGSVSVNYIARWNGSNWASLGSGPYNGAFGPVYAIATSGIPGETVFVGGWFGGAGGISANFIARWNGGDSWSALGSGVNSVVYAIDVHWPYVYAGGDFTTAGSVDVKHIAVWDDFMESWGWLGSPGDGVYGPVYAISGSPTEIYVGGDFTALGTGWGANHIAKWSGSGWSALDEGVNGVVRALALSGTNLYVGGDFIGPGNRIANWNGTRWSALGSGADHSVRAVAASGADVYVGGIFATVSGVNARAIARCEWDGYGGFSWFSLGGSGLGVNDEVHAIAGGGEFVGGGFTAAGTAAAQCIARFSGDHWWALGRPTVSNTVTAVAGDLSHLYLGGLCRDHSYVAEWTGDGWWPIGGGVNDAVHAIAGQYPAVYVGGDFTGGAPFNYIRKWDGGSWSALGSGVDDLVYAIAVGGSDVYAGGWFWKAGGIVVSHIAKWDGSSWSALGSGVNGVVHAIAVSGSNVFVGGEFTQAGSVSATNIARWDGSNWHPLGSGVSGGVQRRVNSIAVNYYGQVYVGGDFTMAGGVSATNIAKWDGSSWSALGSGVNGVVYALAVNGDNDVFVGGAFTTAGGKPSSHFGIWHESREVAAPYLSVLCTSTNTVCVWWRVSGTSWQLQATASLVTGSIWSPCTYQTNGANCVYIESSPTGNRFYRLHKP
jgi:trimeric autotransporter adhesin